MPLLLAAASRARGAARAGSRTLVSPCASAMAQPVGRGGYSRQKVFAFYRQTSETAARAPSALFQRLSAAMALIGVGLVALLALKLEASRPRYKRHKGAYSVPESAAPGAPFRRADKLGDLTTMPFPGCDTIFATFQYAARVNGRRNAVGYRKLLKVRLRAAWRAAATRELGALGRAFLAPAAASSAKSAARCER